MNEDKFREYLKNSLNEYIDSVDLDDADFQQVHADFVDDVKNDQIHKKRKSGIGAKIGVVAATVAAIFVMSIVFSDMPQIKAFRQDFSEAINSIVGNDEDNAEVEYTSLEELQKEENIVLPDFSELLDDYTVENIKLDKNSDGNNYTILFTLINEDNYMDIQLTTLSSEEENVGFESLKDYTQYDAEDKMIFVSTVPPHHAIVYSSMYKVNISTSLKMDQLLENINKISF